MSIFVGNLPFRAEQEDVAELFSPFGDVVNCFLPLERDTGRKRGFAFIEMADPDSESRAIDALQGCELMGRPLRINKAEPRSPGGGGPRRVGDGSARSGGGGYGRSDRDGTAGVVTSGQTGARVVAERASGAKGWEDRSYGSGADSFEAGRTRRRRSGSVDQGGSGD